MGQYGDAAVVAIQCYLLGKTRTLREAWTFGISRQTDSDSSSKKGCPKDAFLGLCEAGVIKGIPPGKYGGHRHNLNGRYAVDAYEILQSEPKLANDKRALWSRIPEPRAKNENGQLDVVLALFNNSLFV